MQSFKQLVLLVLLITVTVCSATWTRCSGSVADDNYTSACCMRDTVKGAEINQKFRLNIWCDVGNPAEKNANGMSRHDYFTACCTTQATGLSWTDQWF